MTTLNMQAPIVNTTYVPRSGTNYTSDQYGMIYGVAIVDALDLEAQGCIILAGGGRNNKTATTNPGVTNDSTQGYAIGSQWLNKNTGILYVATGVGVGAATWGSINGASVAGLPWVTGRFYDLPPGATQAAVLTVLGTLYAVPFFVPNAVTLATIAMSITTGQAGGKARGAIFADNGAGYPGAIVANTDTGDLDATGTNVRTKGSLTTALSAGWYWFGSIYTASSTMPSVIGATATYANGANAAIGAGSAADALATASKAVTGIAITGQTYPATDMPTSFPTFPASAALQSNVTTPIAALGV